MKNGAHVQLLREVIFYNVPLLLLLLLLPFNVSLSLSLSLSSRSLQSPLSRRLAKWFHVSIELALSLSLSLSLWLVCSIRSHEKSSHEKL
jgi:hypothetical protein